MSSTRQTCRVIFLSCLCTLLATPVLGHAWPPDPEQTAPWRTPQLDSLDRLSIDALRARPYGTELKIIHQLGTAEERSDYNERFSSDGSAPYNSYVAAYDSDGLRVYTRLDVPASPAPPAGYPVVMFVHGWYGMQGAPGYDFTYSADSLYSQAIDAWVDAGFMVLSPALRGHGVVNGIQAEGIEFLKAWGNSSYLSPMYYAIDILNLLAGLDILHQQDWTQWGMETDDQVRLDLSRIHINGNSQGGDSTLTALAVAGRNDGLQQTFSSGAMWSGNFAPRFEQLEVFRPMARTLEAFMSGDGSWTGSAEGANGELNPNFVFGWPPDWIGTTDTDSPDWTWQADSWSAPSVATVLQDSYAEAYKALNDGVADINNAAFELQTGAEGKVHVTHDARVEAAMERIGGYSAPQWLAAALLLHHSDQDYYALPRWNRKLAENVQAAGGQVWDFTYPQNTHSLNVSQHEWFSAPGTEPGFDLMLQRDIAVIRGQDPTRTTLPEKVIAEIPDNPFSLSGLRTFLDGEPAGFTVVRERPPLDDMPRRVVEYQVDGLSQFALIIEPAGTPPENGWPVILAAHGHHPNPPDNGRRNSDGVTDRPGDYYRSIPEAFARNGFMVVWPDFRGHNISEGLDQAGGLLEAWPYTRDLLGAWQALPDLKTADASNVFVWGHSMGGEVAMRAALTLGRKVRGVSAWSGVMGHPWLRAQEYGREMEQQLGLWLTDWPFDLQHWHGDVTQFLGEMDVPVSLQHARQDPAVPLRRSTDLARKLDQLGKPVQLHIFDTNEHLFSGADFNQAIERDAAWFRKLMMEQAAGRDPVNAGNEASR